MDVRGAYNLLRTAEGTEWKTAFRTQYGLYESLIILFGLTNAPAEFQRFITGVLHPFLDNFCTAYLDDILISSDILEEHCTHVRQILEVLSTAGLHLKPEKCEFHKTEVKYLGLIISADGIKMDSRKVEGMVGWGSPRDLHDTCAFLGFTNFYQRFIMGYSDVVAPMVWLTKKSVRFKWDEDNKKAFQERNHRFTGTTAPVLQHLDSE